MPGNKCPHCDHRLDGASSVAKDAVPKVGDISICFYCGGLVTFGIGLVLEKMDEVEFFLNGPPHIVEFVKKAQYVLKEKRKLLDALKGSDDGQ